MAGTKERAGTLGALLGGAFVVAALALPVAAVAQERVKVGVLLPLTGATAWGGNPAKIAAELAAREVNDGNLAGKFKLDLVFADGVCDPRASYASADKLINENKAQVLIGEWCSSASVAAAQVAADNKVPMLVQISTADGIAKGAGPYVFQSIMQNFEIQEAEADLLLQTFKFKTAAMLVENNDFGLSFRKNMRKRLEDAGVKFVLDVPQDRHDANWYSTITQIQGANPDIVVASISAGQAANFVKQYAESGLKTPLFFDYPPPPYIFEKQVGTQAGKIGLVRGTFFLTDPNMPQKQKDFVAKFEPLVEKATGEKRPTVHWDLVTYDAVMLVADALKRGGSAKANDFVKSLAAAKLEGVLGNYEFDADRGVKPSGFKFLFIRNTPEGGLEVVK